MAEPFRWNDKIRADVSTQTGLKLPARSPPFNLRHIIHIGMKSLEVVTASYLGFILFI